MFRGAAFYFIALLAVTLVAFWPTYISKLPGGFSGYFHFHAIVMLVWFGLLIVQPLLVRANRLRFHRALGKLSYGIAPVIVVAAILLAHVRLPPANDPSFAIAALYLYLPISMIALFAIAYVLAVVYRRTTALHARYMICTTIALVDPVVGRVIGLYIRPAANGFFSAHRLEQLVSYLVTLAVLALLIYRERAQRRGRTVFPIMLGATSAVYGLWFVLPATGVWLRFAHWFRDLPLT